MPPIHPSSSAPHVKKPMRPLTSYHMFFQIEREYIIQTTAGPIADKAIHANKRYLGDVPRRYRGILLLPDWYAGPGKRKKRKHRKSHGKIGFLELSRVISQRWATLGATDPETKQFVKRIAARELEKYKLEMKHHKELTENVAAPLSPSAAPSPAGAGAAAADTVATMISPGDSPALRPVEDSSSSVPPMMPDLQQLMECTRAESAELVLSLEQDFSSSASSIDENINYSICGLCNDGHYIPSPALPPVEVSSSTVPPMMPNLKQLMQHTQAESAELVLSSERDFASSASSIGDEIDYSICSLSNNGHYIPSPPELSSRRGDMTHPDGTICDPLFELDDGYSFQQPTEKRCVSPLTSEINADNVDIIGDRGVFLLLPS